MKFKTSRQRSHVLGYLITTKPVHTIKNETMYFHTFIDAAGDWLDTIFFPKQPGIILLPVKGFTV